VAKFKKAYIESKAKSFIRGMETKGYPKANIATASISQTKEVRAEILRQLGIKAPPTKLEAKEPGPPKKSETPKTKKKSKAKKEPKAKKKPGVRKPKAPAKTTPAKVVAAKMKKPKRVRKPQVKTPAASEGALPLAEKTPAKAAAAGGKRPQVFEKLFGRRAGAAAAGATEATGAEAAAAAGKNINSILTKAPTINVLAAQPVEKSLKFLAQEARTLLKGMGKIGPDGKQYVSIHAFRRIAEMTGLVSNAEGMSPAKILAESGIDPALIRRSPQEAVTQFTQRADQRLNLLWEGKATATAPATTAPRPGLSSENIRQETLSGPGARVTPGNVPPGLQLARRVKAAGAGGTAGVAAKAAGAGGASMANLPKMPGATTAGAAIDPTVGMKIPPVSAATAAIAKGGWFGKLKNFLGVNPKAATRVKDLVSRYGILMTVGLTALATARGVKEEEHRKVMGAAQLEAAKPSPNKMLLEIMAAREGVPMGGGMGGGRVQGMTPGEVRVGGGRGQGGGF